ncbi:glycosyltransferase [Brachybacterium epidermidis]|uniref:glycosyltransferase n=1 Tax=Brachybacterium epidermidis TaxID=2781983 RepID=UPI00398F78ED
MTSSSRTESSSRSLGAETRAIGGHRARTTAERRTARNQQAIANYKEAALTTGTLTEPDDPAAEVQFLRVASAGERFWVSVLVLFSAASGLVFLTWLVQPGHLPSSMDKSWMIVVGRIGFAMVIVVESIRITQSLTAWVFSTNAKDPLPMVPEPGLKVAFLTTIVPGKEPIEIAERTLEAMTKVEYDGQVDVWILDEGDDDEVKGMCRRLGVNHFTRKGRPEYNTSSGAYRAKTKCGNHNAWRAEHEREYDIVAQLDPDHEPMPSFLQRTVGYFRDPNVGFVVAPQVYGNLYDGLVALGASQQQYQFSSVTERGGNGLGTPILIGTNHLYRPACWSQIGGYQDSIIEDHLTSMHVHATTNPATGRKWKGVYTPDVLAVGEGPTSWADYFNQQKRWAYGIWEILLNPHLQPTGMHWRHRLAYGLIQFYYPSVCISWLLGNLAVAFYLALGVTSLQTTGITWFVLWGLTIVSYFTLFLYLRRFNLASHERRELGAVAFLITLFTGPIYVVAGLTAMLGRKLAYAVTAKGEMRTVEKMSTFRPHLVFAGGALIALIISVFMGNQFIWLRFWAFLTLFAGLTPPILAWIGNLRARREAGVARRPAPAAKRSFADVIEVQAEPGESVVVNSQVERVS